MANQIHHQTHFGSRAWLQWQYTGDAFPIQFPYGRTGLKGDPAITELKEKPVRKQINVFRKLLWHRKPCFHYPLFNLIVENLIMKDTIFLQTKMFCNVKSSATTAMGEKYGTMSPDKLERAIQDARQNRSNQYSNTVEHQFLRSINSGCGKLPHSNEACVEARRIYFSFRLAFLLFFSQLLPMICAIFK